MSIKILCVDDDANILAAYQRNLRKQFDIETALGPEEGLTAIDLRGPFAVIVADMQMPGMNGVQFLGRAREKSPDTVRVMLTGNADQKTAMDAVNEGHVFRFLTKPCPPEVLAQTLTASIAQYRLVTAERELLEQTLSGSVKMMTDILSLLDPQSFGLGQKVREQVRLLAVPLKLAQTWDLEIAALLSQVGYVTIPTAVQQKWRTDQGLTGAEKDILARIPEIGAGLLGNIPRLESVVKIILYQSKNFDGTGFPKDTVAGEEIPLGSRILRIVHDSLLLEARGVPRFKALAKMRPCAGQYDPKLLEAIAAFDVLQPAKAPDAEIPDAISLKDLRVGHVLKSHILNGEGTLIVPEGTAITQVLIEKLQNFAELTGIKEPIYVRT